jgi:hypothetical protein
MESYSSKEAFNASMMVHFRKKIGMELINKINNWTVGSLWMPDKVMTMRRK